MPVLILYDCRLEQKAIHSLDSIHMQAYTKHAHQDIHTHTHTHAYTHTHTRTHITDPINRERHS